VASHIVVASAVSHTAVFRRVVLPAAVGDVCAVEVSLDSGSRIFVLFAVAAVVEPVVEPVEVEVAVAYLAQAAWPHDLQLEQGQRELVVEAGHEMEVAVAEGERLGLEVAVVVVAEVLVVEAEVAVVEEQAQVVRVQRYVLSPQDLLTQSCILQARMC